MIRSILAPWRGWLIATVLIMLLAQSFAVVPPLVVQKIVDENLTVGVSAGLLLLAMLYLGATVAAPSVTALSDYLIAFIAQGALHRLRVKLFAHLQTLPMSYFDQTPLGDIISRCTADVDTVDTLFSTGVASLVTNLLQIVATAIAMVALNIPLSLVAALALPPLIAITQYFRVRVREAERANRVATGLMNTHLQETLSGVEVIRAFHRESVLVARFREALRQVVDAYNRSTVYNSFYPPLMAVLSALVVALLLWVGASGVVATLGVSLGTLTAFVLLFRRFFAPIIALGDDWQTVQSALSGLERIAQVLNIPSEELSKHESRANHPNCYAPIELRAVSFGYFDEQPVLRNVSFAVRPGEHIALVGRTGAGKSSALSLLAGLYAPWSGEVCVANRNPRTLSAEERRRVVGVVPQVVQLFSGTVMENLTLGDSTVSRDEVERAAVIAGADQFIRTLAQGYDTPLSGSGRGGGAQLSAGQRQLLALARALVWNPQVLLLDEATAAVDNASDAAFRAALRADVSQHHRAVLIVAHRLSTAREADRVLVMESGRIIEEGAPEELIARGGRFAALVELETAGWDWRNTT
jgi:ATP-binding cassette subfamily B protein